VPVETHTTERYAALSGVAISEVSPQGEQRRFRRIPRARVRLLARVVAAMLAYYLGARIGFLFQAPFVPQSVLWLPNSILLAVLIVSPPRHWPLYLVASVAPQLLVGYQLHAPLLSVTLLFLTNCADAILGATLWRIASRGELRVQGLRPMILFLIFGATLPTLLVGLADAALTLATHWGTDFRLAYVTRSRANVLTNLIFVPTALAVLGADFRSLVWQWRSRWIEGTLVLSGLLMTSLAVARSAIGTPGSQALSYLPFLFVVWCAVRFGIGMTGASMLVLTYIMTWTSVQGMGLLVHNYAAIVPALQYGLLALAVPTLCLAAGLQDRERAARALAESQMALRQSLAKIQALAGGLLGATERERSRIALELHDHVGQTLVALGLGLITLKRQLPNDERLCATISALEQQARSVAEDVRLLSHELHPASLRYGRLVPAMQELCAHVERSGAMRATFVAQPHELSVTDDVALCIYRVTQEALSNAVRHANARETYVTLRAVGDLLELDVEDNGLGFDSMASRMRGGLGLTSIEERARLVGGTVRIETSRGRGARISLRIPYGGAQGATDAAARG
jgi:two-component system sensor histidine kinase UhpB